jgi:hypothetical protein
MLNIVKHQHWSHRYDRYIRNDHSDGPHYATPSSFQVSDTQPWVGKPARGKPP